MTAMTLMGRATSTAAPGGTPALVVVAHGSRDPRALSTVRALLDRVRALRPGLPVHLGHIELNEPLLPDTLADLGDGAAILVPLLLSRGHHVKRDIPETAAASPAHTRVSAPLGPHPLLVDALHDRFVEAGWPVHAGPDHAVVLASAGSRAPDSRTDTARTAALLSARLGVPVIPAYASAAAPTVPEAVRAGGPGLPQRRHRLVLHRPGPLRDGVRGAGTMDRIGPTGHPPGDGPPPPSPLRPGIGGRRRDQRT